MYPLQNPENTEKFKKLKLSKIHHPEVSGIFLSNSFSYVYICEHIELYFENDAHSLYKV